MNTETKDNLVIAVAGIGMLLSTLDTGIINVALPFFKAYFETTANITAIAVTGYTASLAVFILPFGLLSDKFGKLVFSYIGLILFGISSLLCGFSTNIQMLITFRILQGIGAAALQATSASLITTLVSKEKSSSAIGILGIMIGLGPILGPSLGGLLLSLNSWKGIFWLNIPFIILGVLCNQKLIRYISETKYAKTVDYSGSLINGLFVVLLISGLSLLSSLTSIGMVLIISSLLVMGILIKVEKDRKTPIIDVMNLIKKRSLLIYLYETMAFGFASAIIFLMPPYLFETVFKLNSGLTGILVLGAPIGLVLFSRISSAHNDGLKDNLFSKYGLVIILCSFLLLLMYQPFLPYILVTICLFVYGIGGGYFQPANISAIMKTTDITSQGSIGSLQRMIQNVAIAIGTAVGSLFLNMWSNKIMTAIKFGWITAGGLIVLAIVLELVIGKRALDN
ncbi:MFS transporter [Limosilactobacillus sp. STM2_1]|uniref:MFS transporter n=1 Tax=Limosilactobacillus rudii TaxID=2759755 RepID=A0A7W3YN87_9LACO|nr:MFS transporter [Limosilactobacillus rudii]MBB1079276.1 MFS transporter [Limosilactobacillus rudii]MBB1098264.1 MFS transporter [Limosilactobacillus rudii]MCD7134346.1 MFS transporter [Limosilactobacillus rudii]